ncbi:hypothetical protein C8R46DRAFT_1191683 [Mycena filopes]|nr:hypothetical protein C8R46DRAFT_1191683 [Mycena filopes]
MSSSDSMPVDEDVFSRILSQIPDSKTVHVVLRALSKSHPLFPAAFRRLCELPIHLDTFDARAAAASNEVLDYLLNPEDHGRAAESIRHLVVAVEHDKYGSAPRLAEDDEEEEEDEEEAGAQGGEEEENPVKDVEEEETEQQDDDDEEEPPTESEESESESEPDEDVDVVAFHARLPALFEKTRNLRSLDYQSCPGLPLSREDVALLASCERLHTFAADTAVRETSWGYFHAFEDPETWDIEPFLSTLAPNIRSLSLRHVCLTMLRTLVSHGDVFATYTNLDELQLDITEGVWDWTGAGSPQRGATADYVFPSLRLPALRRLELVVADLTLSKARAGPLELVDCSLLTELSLDIREINGYDIIPTISLFEALGAADFPVLSHLEIKDNNGSANQHRLKWEPDDGFRRPQRSYPGLVERLLGPLGTLSTLWVDERILLQVPSGVSCGVRDLWDADFPDFGFFEAKASWKAALDAALPRLESLRTGFGALDAVELGFVLGQCDRTKLRQFGFRYAWKKYGRDEPISPDVLLHLSRFPKLTDVHILFPRPEKQFTGVPNPVVDPQTLADVASIFRCNGSISRVGIGNSIVWQRGVGADEVLLVSDGNRVPNDALSRFYHAGHMVKYNPKNKKFWVHFDNVKPLRPNWGEEIEELRDVLRRIIE